MNALRHHRGWLILLTLAIALIAGSGPLSHLAREEAAHELSTIREARAKAEQNVLQLRADVAAARALSDRIDRAKADRLLAPVDRLKAVTILEDEAGKNKLSKFTYTLAPEERVSINTGGEAQELAISTIALAADAPDDAFVYAYIEHVRAALPGRARIRQLTVARTGGSDTPLSVNNVHFEAELEWLSNGALQTVASGP